MFRPARLAAFGVIWLLAACGGSGPRQPGPAELSLATDALDAQLNATPQSLARGLDQANRDKRVYSAEIHASGAGGEQVFADWWAWNHGLLRMGGHDSYFTEFFTLTPKGEALARDPRVRWVRSVFKAPPNVVCAGSSTWTSCRLSGVAEVRPAPEAASLFTAPSFPEQTFQAVLEYGPQGWRVSELQPTDPAKPAQAVQRAMFGSEAQAAKARNRYAVEVNRLAR